MKKVCCRSNEKSSCELAKSYKKINIKTCEDVVYEWRWVRNLQNMILRTIKGFLKEGVVWEGMYKFMDWDLAYIVYPQSIQSNHT